MPPFRKTPLSQEDKKRGPISANTNPDIQHPILTTDGYNTNDQNIETTTWTTDCTTPLTVPPPSPRKTTKLPKKELELMPDQTKHIATTNVKQTKAIPPSWTTRMSSPHQARSYTPAQMQKKKEKSSLTPEGHQPSRQHIESPTQRRQTKTW